MSPRLYRVLSALAGIAGVLMLGTSFAINPGPPPGASTAQLVEFARLHSSSILWGAWLQAVGTILSVVFALAIVTLARATTKLSGWLTLFGGGVLATVSLVETVCYIGALFPSPTADPTTMALVCTALGHSVQHLFFIAGAPALFLPLGGVILGSRIVSRAFGYLAFALGAAFAIAGLATMTTLIVPDGATALAVVQALWWLAVAIALIVRRERPTMASIDERGPDERASAA